MIIVYKVVKVEVEKDSNCSGKDQSKIVVKTMKNLGYLILSEKMDQ